MTDTLPRQDRALINSLQDDLPLEHRPFASIADQIGISEDRLLNRTAELYDAGILTRFGPFFDAEAMGGAFCLCALSAPPERFEAVAEIVNAYPEVAHNYERDHRLNMWFVLAAETERDIDHIAGLIEHETALPVLRFPKLQEFFIGFRVVA